jgi:hypothetical protein
LAFCPALTALVDLPFCPAEAEAAAEAEAEAEAGATTEA